VGELREACQVVAREQLVDVRLGHHHAQGVGGEVGAAALVGVQPDDPVAQPRQPLHRGLEQLGVAPVQPVGADHDDPAAGHPTPRPPAHELVEAGTDPSAAFPVGHRRGRPVQGEVGAPVLELTGDPGEPRAEAEHLGAVRRPARGVRELHQAA
jgi:hypothetical protein